MATRLPIARLTKARENLKTFSNQETAHQQIAQQKKRQNAKATKKGNLDKWMQVIAAEKERAIHEPQFHLHPLNDAKDPNVIQIHMPMMSFPINLRWLRAVLVLANLVLLMTGYRCFQAWANMSEIKDQANLGLSQQERDKDPFNVPHHWLHEYHHSLAHGFAHGDQIFFACGVLLISYYMVFGCFIPFIYGKTFTDMSFSVLGGVPISIVVGPYLVFTAWAFDEFHQELNSINLHLASLHLSYMRVNALLGVREYLNQIQPEISILLLISATIMVVQNLLLPFCMYDLPFQRQMDVDDFVLCFDPKAPRTVRSWRNNNDGESRKIIPYRDLSAAYTVMLFLVKPELRDFHRQE